MLVIPQLFDGKILHLDAYSFDEKELEAVKDALDDSGVKYEIKDILPDKEKRKGRRFIIRGNAITLLEDYLGLKFVRESVIGGTDRTTIEVVDGGSPFKCEEISLKNHKKGCEDVKAKNQSAATLKCALVAKKKGWFGGVASPGVCKLVKK